MKTTNNTRTITATITRESRVSSVFPWEVYYRVSFATPDGVARTRTGSLHDVRAYAEEKAREHRCAVRFA